MGEGGDVISICCSYLCDSMWRGVALTADWGVAAGCNASQGIGNNTQRVTQCLCTLCLCCKKKNPSMCECVAKKPQHSVNVFQQKNLPELIMDCYQMC
jgi:hypothetical protein